jgi:hypothetical protein
MSVAHIVVDHRGFFKGEQYLTAITIARTILDGNGAAREAQKKLQRWLESLIGFADGCDADPVSRAIAKRCYTDEELTRRYMVELLQMFRPISKLLRKTGSLEGLTKDEIDKLLNRVERDQVKLAASVIVVQEKLFRRELYTNTVQRAKDFLRANGISITSDGLQLTEETGVRKDPGSF